MTAVVADRVLNWYLRGIVLEAGAGSESGVLLAYSGQQPVAGAPPGAAALLGTIILADPLGTVSNRILTFDPSTPDLVADASGLATWSRIADSDLLWVADFDLSIVGGGGTMQIDDPQVYAGGKLSLANAIIRV